MPMALAGSTIRVTVVEDSRKTRDMLSAIFAGSPGFELAGAHRTGESALLHVAKEAPDVLLVDLELTGINGAAVLRQCAREQPRVERVVLTGHDEPEWVFPALKAGANGYLLKGIAPDKLLEALQLVCRGGSWMSPGIARLVLQEFRRQQATEQHPAQLQALSKRELEVLQLLSQGYQTKEIAGKLFLGERTVSSHLHKIYGKLHVRCATQAVITYHRAQTSGRPTPPPGR